MWKDTYTVHCPNVKGYIYCTLYQCERIHTVHCPNVKGYIQYCTLSQCERIHILYTVPMWKDTYCTLSQCERIHIVLYTVPMWKDTYCTMSQCEVIYTVAVQMWKDTVSQKTNPILRNLLIFFVCMDRFRQEKRTSTNRIFNPPSIFVSHFEVSRRFIPKYLGDSWNLDWDKYTNLGSRSQRFSISFSENS